MDTPRTGHITQGIAAIQQMTLAGKLSELSRTHTRRQRLRVSCRGFAKQGIGGRAHGEMILPSSALTLRQFADHVGAGRHLELEFVAGKLGVVADVAKIHLGELPQVIDDV